MSRTFEAIPVTDRVYWVGAIDWGLRNFHGYLTSRGTTYNAYLVLTDRITLIDTVKRPFREEMLTRISSIVDPSDIDVIVSNHSEMDHTGALPETVAQVRPTTVIASTAGARALQDHFHWDRVVQIAKNGETFELGNGSLTFFETRMLHWPDSMFCYYRDEGLLFTNDAFGMHLASTERFADQLDPALLRYEAAKYYANILLPYSKKVTKLVETLPNLDLDIAMILPDHGPIWRENPLQVVDWYREWADQRPRRKAVVVYDTMWQSTAIMARAITEGLVMGGIGEVKVMPLEGSHRSDVATEILDAGALLVGSPTMNNEIYPTVADLMTYLKGLRPQNKVGAAFGSYGWSGQAVKQLEQWLDTMKVDLVQPGASAQYVPDETALEQCRELGAKVAAQLEERLG